MLWRWDLRLIKANHYPIFQGYVQGQIQKCSYQAQTLWRKTKHGWNMKPVSMFWTFKVIRGMKVISNCNTKNNYKIYWRCYEDRTFAIWKQNIAQFFKVMFKVKVTLFRNAPIRLKPGGGNLIMSGVWNKYQCCVQSRSSEGKRSFQLSTQKMDNNIYQWRFYDDGTFAIWK